VGGCSFSPDKPGERRRGFAPRLGACSFVGGDVLQRGAGDAGGADGVDAVGGGEGAAALFGLEVVGELGWRQVEDVAEEVGGEGGVGEEGGELGMGGGGGMGSG
jgi:hypothetical protein